jgi:phenylalanine-4-hydroxylase
VIFSVKSRPGALRAVLQVLDELKVDMKHIESRPNRFDVAAYDFYVTMAVSSSDAKPVVEAMSAHATIHSVFDHNPSLAHPCWFPRTITDLDEFAHRVLDAGAELQADHPGFRDPEYRARRNYLADVAIKYRHGTPIPRIDYTQAEISTWYHTIAPTGLVFLDVCN